MSVNSDTVKYTIRNNGSHKLVQVFDEQRHDFHSHGTLFVTYHNCIFVQQASLRSERSRGSICANTSLVRGSNQLLITLFPRTKKWWGLVSRCRNSYDTSPGCSENVPPPRLSEVPNTFLFFPCSVSTAVSLAIEYSRITAFHFL